MARVRTSAHCLWTRETIAPSALKTQRCNSCSGFGSPSVAVSATAMQAPMYSESWRAVSSLVCTHRIAPTISAALSKGMKLAKCTRCSCCRGARLPGSNPNSSSRGKKTLSTLWACTVGSRERHIFSSIALQRPLLLAPCLQWRCAFGTLCCFSS